jgi:transcriptional regulator NrdR family protein
LQIQQRLASTEVNINLQGSKGAGMKMRLKVIKADGSMEKYLHTKVIGTISYALGQTDQADICIAEKLADVVTYFLYHKQKKAVITSSEIFSVIKVVLTATGYEEAALELNDIYFERKLKRSRIEIIPLDIGKFADAEIFSRTKDRLIRSPWNKSQIAKDLIKKHKIQPQVARTIASSVEEKVLSMGSNLLPLSLVKQLVLGETAAILRAQHQLQTV